MLVGYARCSTDQQDLTAQPDALTALGVKPNRIYVDHGLTSTNRAPWFARSAGRVPVRRKQPKLKPAQEAHLVELWRAGKHTSAELAEPFSVARSTVYRAVQRAGEPKTARTRRA